MMYKKIFSLGFILMFFLFISGCMVTKDTYMQKVAEADSQAKENAALKDKVKVLTSDRDQLKEAFANATKEKEDLNKVLESKSDSLTQNIMELRKNNSTLESENLALKESVAALKKSKEEEVKSIKKAHDDLMQEMKAEVAKEQITITELKGKLTLDVVDKILFASGEADVKPEGLAVLQRVIDVLKKVKDKAIRIEGHTDNIQIKGQLTKKYATNWELSAARAINVTRFLQKQGISPSILSATAFGEYKPVASNSSSEGRAKNRRIAIILLPKE